VSVTDLAFRDGILDFVDLDLTEALDLEQVATRSRVHRSDRVVAIGLEFRDVDSTDAVRLNGINVDDEAVLHPVSQLPLLSGCQLLTYVVA
jgi:hypothetical protein